MPYTNPAEHHRPADTTEGRAKNAAAFEILSAIRHFGVVRPVELTDDGTLITRLAGRTTLADQPPRDVAGACEAAASLAATLGDLHEMGIAHRYIDPSHAIVGPAGRIVLCSFSRARQVGPDSAAFRADLVALADMVECWADDLADTATRAERGDLRRLGEAVRALRSSTGGARAATQILDRSPEQRRQRHMPRRQPAPRHAVDQERERHSRRWLAPLGGLAASALTIYVLTVLRPATPALTGGATGVDTLVMNSVRLASLAAAGYLAAVCALALVAAVAQRPGLEELGRRISPGWLWRTAAGTTAIGVLATVSSPPSGTEAPRHQATELGTAHNGAEFEERALPSPSRIPETTTSTTSTTTPANTTTPASTTRSPIWERPHDAVDAAAEPWDVTEAEETATGTSAAHQMAAATAANQWTVRPGDHLWRIAELTVTSRLQRVPTTAEIDGYWRDLIDNNRHRLADAANPDLLFVGQVLELPQ